MNRTVLIILDKTLFRVLFFLVALVTRSRRKLAGRKPILPEAPSFLVIRPGGLGDGIMTLPFLRSLREHYPGSHIAVICVKKNKATIATIGHHDELIVLDDLKRLLSNFRDLRRRRYDIVFDLEPFRRTSAIVAAVCGAKCQVGFDTNSRRKLYSHLVTYKADSCFESENMARQLGVLGILVPPDEVGNLEKPLTAEIRSMATDILVESGLDDWARIIAIAPGVLKPHHRWEMEKFAGLGERILKQDPKCGIVLLGADRDLADATEVEELINQRTRVKNFVGKLSLSESAALLSRCAVLIACDGGIVYIAANVGCKTLSLWGPGVMERFKPPGNKHFGVRESFSCIPCVTWDRLGEFPPCPFERRCYTQLSVDRVHSAYTQLTER